jgi:hypothetical protein
MRHEAARVLREVARRIDCQSDRDALEECADQIDAAAAESARAVGLAAGRASDRIMAAPRESAQRSHEIKSGGPT